MKTGLMSHRKRNWEKVNLSPSLAYTNDKPKTKRWYILGMRERERAVGRGGYIMGIYMNLSESVITTSPCDGTGIMVWIGASISHIAEIQRH